MLLVLHRHDPVVDVKEEEFWPVSEATLVCFEMVVPVKHQEFLLEERLDVLCDLSEDREDRVVVARVVCPDVEDLCRVELDLDDVDVERADDARAVECRKQVLVGDWAIGAVECQFVVDVDCSVGKVEDDDRRLHVGDVESDTCIIYDSINIFFWNYSMIW